MAKAKTGKKKKEDDLLKTEITYIIRGAVIKDDFCNYSYEIITGVGRGDTHNVKGVGIIKDDMHTAYSRLAVHLAIIDDVYKHSSIEIEDVDKLHTHDLTTLYHVTGIKISGSKDNESVVLIGNKYVSCAGGRIELASPKIPMDNLSSYKWYNELKTAVDDVREEVAAYKEGKYTPVDVEEEDDATQLTIGDNIEE